MSVCPISPDYLYWAMLVAAVLFSIYLASKKQSNPYDDRNLFADAKSGNVWAKVNIAYAVIFGVFMGFFFVCLGG